MMDYNDIFKELDRLTETEKSYICCNDTKNYKMDRSIIICKKCNTRKNDATSSDDLRNLADAWESELERKNNGL